MSQENISQQLRLKNQNELTSMKHKKFLEL